MCVYVMPSLYSFFSSSLSFNKIKKIHSHILYKMLTINHPPNNKMKRETNRKKLISKP